MALTREQFQELRDKGLTVDQIVRFERGEKPASSVPQEPKPTFGQNLKTLRDTRTAEAMESVAARERGEQGTARTLFQLGGQVVGSAFDPVVAGVQTLAPRSTDVPGPVSKTIGAIASPFKKAFDFTTDKLSDIPAVQKFAQTPQSAALERDVKAVREYVNLLPGPKGVGKAANATVDATTKATSAAVDTTGKALMTVLPSAEKKAFRVASAIDDLEQTYKDIERGWVSTRKASEKAAQTTILKNKSGTVGRTPERVLAEHGIIPDFEGTKFSTVVQANKLREQVKPLYEANRAALREAQWSTEPVTFDALEKQAIALARSEKNIAAGTADQLEANIRKEFAGYRKNYGESVPLTTLDEIKSARWGNTKFSLTKDDKLYSDTNYLIAKAAQETIEQTAAKAGAMDVAQLNREIGDILEASKFLESLDGKAVLYGRMGTHMTRLAGTVAGSAAGGVAGGIAGAVGGDLVARGGFRFLGN